MVIRIAEDGGHATASLKYLIDVGPLSRVGARETDL